MRQLSQCAARGCGKANFLKIKLKDEKEDKLHGWKRKDSKKNICNVEVRLAGGQVGDRITHAANC